MEQPKPIAILVGADGNVFNLIAICVKAMKKEGYSKERIDEFTKEVYSSENYYKALAVMSKWCDVR